MPVWHIMLGIGFGLLATVLTIIANNQRQRFGYIDKGTEDTGVYSTPEDNCTICLTGMSNDNMKYLNCGHAFHKKCLEDIRRHKFNDCPICRKNI